MPGMITTLRMHVRNKDSRKFFRTYLSGKLIGLGLVIGFVYLALWFIGTKAGASMLHAEPLKADDVVNPINTMWVLCHRLPGVLHAGRAS